MDTRSFSRPTQPQRSRDADWQLFGGSFVIDNVAVLWPKELGERLLVSGDLLDDSIDDVHHALAQALPVA